MMHDLEILKIRYARATSQANAVRSIFNQQRYEGQSYLGLALIHFNLERLTAQRALVQAGVLPERVAPEHWDMG